MWRRNHLPLTARIRHSYHELLQICVAEVKCLCEVWVKCLASHSIRNCRLNWNLHVGPGHSKEFAWTISWVSHKTRTTKKWCSGKQHSLVPSGPWFEPMPWQIIFATFRDIASADLAKMLTCGTLENLMTTWNTLFSKKCLHVGPNWILWWLGTLYFKIMLTCGTDVGLWRFFRAYGVTKQHGTGNTRLQCQP